MWGNEAVYKSLCAWFLIYPTPGGARGKQSCRDQRGVLGLGHALHSPPAHHSQQLLSLLGGRVGWGGHWRGRLPGYAFRLPYPLNPSSLLVNSTIKALTFNKTWEWWMPQFFLKKRMITYHVSLTQWCLLLACSVYVIFSESA